MITEYKEYNIICDDCEITGNHEFRAWCHERDKNNTSLIGTELFSNIGIRDLRKTARKYGWILKQSDNGKIDICPKCSTKPEHRINY